MVDVWFAVALLIAPVFAEYAKIRVKAEKAFSMVALAGLFLLLAGSFQVQFFNMAAGYSLYAVYLFEFLGWLVLLIGVLWAATKLVK